MTIFFLLLASLLCGGGMAIILVEKGHEWPVRLITIPLRRFLQVYVHRKMHRLLRCAICTAFWTTLISDLFLLIASHGHYFLWPISGFATAGILWLIYRTHYLLEQRIQPPIIPPSYNPDSLAEELKKAHEEDSQTPTV